MSQANNPTPEPPELPVDGASSIFEVLGDADLMKEWLEGLEAPNIEKTRQETGHAGAHTLGENAVRGLGLRNWMGVMESLEKTAHPLTGEPPHSLIQHPGAFLDNIIHISEVDKLRLKYQEYDGLPRTRRKLFEYLNDPETPVDVGDLPSVGGVDAAMYGSPGSGKSTLAVTLAARIMEINNEVVVWRGSQARSEWLPLAPWTTVCLPSGVDVRAELAPPDDDSAAANVDFEPIEIDLERVVRKVEFYDDLEDLNNYILEQGAFHVVYPDPKFRDCEGITRRAAETKPLTYNSAWEVQADDDLGVDDITPDKFWWMAWLIHQNSEAPPSPVSWFCDEVKGIFPNGAEKADHNHPRYIRAVSDKYIDMRRNGVSNYYIGHNLNTHISHHLRSLMRWGITMNGASNPVNEEVLSGRAPMSKDMASTMPVGQALIWNVARQEFTPLPWDDINDEFKIPGKLRVTYPGAQEVKEAC